MDIDLVSKMVTRRSVLKSAVVAGGSLLATSLLAACGGDDDDDEATATAPPAAATATPAPGAPTPTPGAAQPTATTAAAPTPTPAGDQPKQGGTLIFGFSAQQLLSLDPPRVQVGIVAGELLPNLFSSLVQFDEGLNVVPDLAESWDISEDGLVYTFNLREGLKFHNGDPLVAEDFVYTFERTKSEELASPHANKLRNVTTAEAVDELTFRMTFSAPFGPFLAIGASRGPGRAVTPVPRRAVEEMGNDEFNLKPVGCGPFMLVPETMDPQVGFEMVAFEDWYGGRPHLDKVIVRLIPEPSSRINALEAGDIDMLDIVPTQGYEQLSAVDTVEIVEAPGTNWLGLQMNVTEAPWDKLEARLAVAKAIDKQDFINRARFGLGTIGGPIAPAFGWCYIPPDQIEGTPQAFDLEAAKQLAEQAGIAGAKPVLIASASNDRDEQIIRNMLAEIGVDVQIELLQDAELDERWSNGEYTFSISGSNVDADPDDNVFNFFYSTGPWNTGKWVSQRADELLDATRATADQEKRAEAFRELQQHLHEEAPHAFLLTAPDIVGYQTYVKGYRVIPEQRYLEAVWLDK